jgi:AraC-like DNA-binding protein
MRAIRSECANTPGSEPQVVAAPTAALAVVGFSDHGHLSRQFGALVGIAPSSYPKMNR